MKNLLVCTIMRNCRSSLERWIEQLTDLHQRVMGEYEIFYSIAENDSTDGTAEWLRVHCGSGERNMLSTDTLGTKQYGSIWNIDRLKNLTNARQRCLDQAQVKWGLDTFSKIAYIEVDVSYDPFWTSELILARHPLAAGLGEPDVYSGWSLRSEANPKESVFLYDCCATRATRSDICWDVNEDCGQWRGKTVVPTDLGGVDAMCLHPVWSTFNCFCVYNAKPFIHGHRWTYWNRRINPGSNLTVPHPDGDTVYLEADTVAICETFRQYDYNKIFLNTNCLIRHS